MISNQSEVCVYMCLEYHVFKPVFWPGLYLEAFHLIVFTQTYSESLDVVSLRIIKDVMIMIEVVQCCDVLMINIPYEIFLYLLGIFVQWISEGVEASLVLTGCGKIDKGFI